MYAGTSRTSERSIGNCEAACQGTIKRGCIPFHGIAGIQARQMLFSDNFSDGICSFSLSDTRLSSCVKGIYSRMKRCLDSPLARYTR